MPARDLSQLYRHYGPTIYARCRRLLPDDAAAEDATQETFLRVLRHLERTPDEREALLWIYRIATNYCLNVMRDQRRWPEEPEELVQSGNLEQSLADRDFVSRVLRQVPRKLAEVAWLHHAEGMHQGEVATVLGISRRTVVSRLADFVRRAQRFIAKG